MSAAALESATGIADWAETQRSVTVIRPTQSSTDQTGSNKAVRKRLLPEQRIRIRELTEKGLTGREIAAEIGCALSTVQDAQRDVIAVAKEIIRTGIPKLAVRVAQTKDAKTALKVLQAYEVVPRDEPTVGGMTVQIGIALPGLSPSPGLSPATFATKAIAVEPVSD